MAKVTVTPIGQISVNIMALLAPSAGVQRLVREKAAEVAVVANALQDPSNLGADIHVEMTTMRELGIAPVETPVGAVVFTGTAWHDKRGDQDVAGTPNSGKRAVEHFAKGAS